MTSMFTDAELRTNHDFVLAFETLRKQHHQREMHDVALRQIADATDLDYRDLRVARSLRNALAHGEAVNRETLQRHLDLLRGIATPARPDRAVLDADDVRAYRVHAWQDPRLEQEMLANGFVAIGGAEIGDLSDVHDPEVIRARLTRSMPDRKPKAISLFVGYWRRFRWEAESGDLVVLPTRDRLVSIGEFVGPYHYTDGPEPRVRHRRPVSWLRTGIYRDAFDSDLVTVLNGQHTVQDFTTADAVDRLRRITRSASSGGAG